MLLANLLRTLSEDELRQIRKDFRLPERSRLIFERIATSPSSPPTVEGLTKVFRITKANFYSLCSEIVDESVRILAPKEEFSTLTFFKGKYLYRPFVTEARRIEKRLLHEKEKEAIERFYAYVFLSLRAFTADVIDVDLVDEYGKKWHRAKANPPIDDELHILLRGIVTRVAAVLSRKKMNVDQMQTFARALLDPIAKQAETSLNPHVRYEYYYAKWIASSYENTGRQTQIKWLECALNVLITNATEFEPYLFQRIELEIAYSRALNSEPAEESLRVFQKYHHGQTPETNRGILFFLHFITVAFLARHFEIAWNILEEFEQYHVVQTTPALLAGALLLRCRLEITEGSYDNASSSIVRAKVSNGEDFYLPWEIEIRGLETVVALKRKDFTLADQLAERNISWLRSRRMSLAKSSWIYYYQLITAIIKFRLAGEPIRTLLLKHFTKDFRGEYPDFFLLLESDIQKAIDGKT
jgi:hypothetical protein